MFPPSVVRLVVRRVGASLALALLLLAPAGAATLEDLVGLWKTPTGSIVEMKLDASGRLEGRLTEVSADGRRRRFQINDPIVRNVAVNGDTFSFEVALRENTTDNISPHPEVWLTCTGGRLDRGTLVGPVENGVFRSHRWETRPGSMEFALIPRCPKLEGTLEVGTLGGSALVVTLSEPIAMEKPAPGETPVPDDRAREGFCRLEGSGVASVALQTADLPGANGAFRIGKTITGCDLELFWKEYTDARTANGLDEISLAWTDDGTSTYQVCERWGIGVKIYGFGATFKRAPDGTATIRNGFCDVQMDVDGPAQALGPFYLTGDVSGLISYVWRDTGNGAAGWDDGTWSFDSVGNLFVELRRGGYDPIATAALTVTAGGDFTGTFTLNAQQDWSSGGYKITLQSCDLAVQGSFKDGSLIVTGGGITGAIEAGAPLNGNFGFSLARRTIDQNGARIELFAMTISSTSQITAFGGRLTDINLSTNLVPDTLEFTKIEGSVRYEHPDMTVAIGGFTVENGELTRFLGSGNVSYKGFALNIRQLRYDASATPAIIDVAAAVNLGWSNAGAAAAELENFKIATDGVVSSFSLRAGVNASPVEVQFAAAFTGAEFSGRFQGQFAGGADFGGTVVIGRHDDFAYGGLGIFFNIRGGVPIGQTGLKLLGLNGGFGCNYNPEGSPLGAPFGARRDTYYIQAGLTIGDAVGLASLNGTVSLVLGDSKAVGIAGLLQVTQQTPYFRGGLTCNYVLGSGELSGGLASTVRIPIDGSIVSIDNNLLNYRIDSAGWRLRGAGLGGTFFNFLRLHDGGIDLHNDSPASIASMTGTMGMRISGRTGARWAYPSDFRCESESYDFGIAANFSAEVSGALNNVRLSTAGTEGRFQVHVALSGSGSLRLRSGWFGFDCTSVGLTASGTLNARKTNRDLALDGALLFADSSGWISKELNFSGVF